jgi:activin receptor type-2B
MVLSCYSYKFNVTGNHSTCNSFEQCATLIKCGQNNSQSLCFALAKLEYKPETNNETVTILSAGCYEHESLSDNCNTAKCLGDYRQSADNYYCCCNQDNCNGRPQLRPKPKIQESTTPIPEQNTSSESSLNQPVILFAAIILFTVFLGLYLRRSRLNRKVKMDRNNLLALANLNTDKNGHPHQIDNHVRIQQEPKFDLKNIELLELIGSGRFGTVHKANLSRSNDTPNNHTENGDCETQQLITIYEIAVKIINNSEYQSFHNELNIYNLSRMRHPNILTFLGSCENPQTNSNWLLVEYASNGSLHHYLKEHTVTWNEFLEIALGIVRGLSHLHDADVAHRDFKSKNVLLRRNLSPCITDFGVATILDMTGGSQTQQRKNYLQVGTPRYMAPEVLECSVAFTKISFTKIDVYALSLVLWELLSRCHPLPKLRRNDYDEKSTINNIEDAPCDDEVLPYRMPFEDQVGSNPDINTMRQVVVCDKLRPPFRDCWSYYPISRMSQAIVDGWEYDHDARISASCFVERIESLPPER